MELMNLSMDELLIMKKNIQIQIESKKQEKENFMYRDEKDDYIYIVYFYDDTRRYYQTGQKAYNDYLKAEAAKIGRKTKTLFPVFETLLEKNQIIA